jgi:hypothetical protein
MKNRTDVMLPKKRNQRIKKEKKKEFPEKLWDFFNTSLGIWALTTIVVGLLTWGYTKWQVSNQNGEQIFKLDTEIESRLDAALRDLKTLKKGELKPPFYLANKLLLPSSDNTIHSEFSNRTLKSLFYELQGRLPKDDEGSRFNLLLHLRGINHLQQNFSVDAPPEETIKIYEEQVTYIKSSRWSEDKMSERRFEVFYPAWYLTYWDVIYLLIIASLFFLSGFLIWPDWQKYKSKNGLKNSSSPFRLFLDFIRDIRFKS